MDAWDTLVAGSTLASGDAWEHLNAQSGGTGSETIIVHADGMEVEMATTVVDVEVDQAPVEVSVDQSEIAVEINQEPVEVTV